MIKKRKRTYKKKNPENLINLSWNYYIPINELKIGFVYYTKGRSLGFAIYKGNNTFIGIREKFKNKYLDYEYHWDIGEPSGTLKPILKLEKLPDDIITEKQLFKYLTKIEKKYWPQIWPIEEERKKIFHEQRDREKLKREKEFGPYLKYCVNCEYTSEKGWGARCPNCSYFGGQLMLRLKDNSLWITMNLPYDQKKK